MGAWVPLISQLLGSEIQTLKNRAYKEGACSPALCSIRHLEVRREENELHGQGQVLVVLWLPGALQPENTDRRSFPIQVLRSVAPGAVCSIEHGKGFSSPEQLTVSPLCPRPYGTLSSGSCTR